MLRSSPFILWVFTLTLFLSATLLFLVQPVAGKMLLPLLGGAPAVWNTCIVFFQAALLGGYLYAHGVTRLGIRRQILVHAVLLMLPLLVLPITVRLNWLQPGEANPVLQVLTLLALSVGLPFFVVSTSAPLLQRWFAITGHATAHDPYFLYGASNLGSMAALLGYPILVEPSLRLASQSQLWTVGYGLLALLTLGCASLVWTATGMAGATPQRLRRPMALSVDPVVEPRLSYGTCLRWLAFACIPSSLMLGVTTYITTDIAALPLLWVLPLGLYLLSFILVFGRCPQWVHRQLANVAPVVLLVLIFLTIAHTNPPFWKTWMTILFHLLVLFVVAMVCHGELARRRPPATQLTAFYLWMSLGGVCGGLLNAILAPMIFTRVAEYPLGLALACFLLPARHKLPATSRNRWLDVVVPLGIAALLLSLTSQTLVMHLRPDRFSALLGLAPDQLNDFCIQWLRFDLEKVNVFLKFGIPVVLCYLCTGRPWRFGLGVSALVLVSLGWGGADRDVLYRARSFFGALQVERSGNYHRLMHGTTLHGAQHRDRLQSQEPTTYYHRTGPIGQVFAAFTDTTVLEHIAAIGLGTGTLACYGEPGRSLTFYEIDPTVYRIASDPQYFTYLQDAQARGTRLHVVLGDARLKLAAAPDGQYGLLIVDAFSSDAIPVHLLTREALQLYLAKLAEGGLLALHITNRHLELAPVLGNLAQEANLAGLMQLDRTDETVLGKLSSRWVILARHQKDLDRLRQNTGRWNPLPTRAGVGVWTDDFSDMLSIFLWKQ